MIDIAWISSYHNMRFVEMIWAFPSFWAIGQINVPIYKKKAKEKHKEQKQQEEKAKEKEKRKKEKESINQR